VNYDNSLVVTITVTCYSWAPSSGDRLFSCGAISRPPHVATKGKNILEYYIFLSQPLTFVACRTASFERL